MMSYQTQRKRLKNALLLFLLVMLGVCLLPKTALANENECSYVSKDEVMAYTSSLLETVSESENYPSTFMIPEFSIDGIMVGDPVKCYDIIDGQTVYSDADYWPVLFNSEIICSVASIDNGDGTVSFILSSGVAPELNAAYYANEPCAVILEGETFEDEVITPSVAQATFANYAIESDTSEANGIEFFQQDDFVALDANAADVAYTAVDESANGSSATYAVPRPTNINLWVPSKYQGEYGMCWACSVASIGQYMTGMNYSGSAICDKLHIGYDAGGVDTDVINALRLFKYGTSATHINGQRNSGPLSDQYIYNWISSGIPIYAYLSTSDNKSAHAVAVCGCQNTLNGVFTVTVMNPGHGAREVMTKNSINVLELSYNKTHYQWSRYSILLTGWQKPGNQAKWVYIASNNGLRTTGWLNLSGTYYCFDSNGNMYEAEWYSDGTNWYYLKAGGAMVKSQWLKLNGYWYAFNNSGAMRRGWYQDSKGDWYYLRTATNSPGTGPDGSMLANGTWTINGKSYTFNASGVCLNP